MKQMELFSDMQEPVIKISAKSVQQKKIINADEKVIVENKKEQSKRGRKSFKENFTDVELLNIPADEILFSKQYYSITEVATWFAMNPSVLRLWEKNFSIIKPKKNGKGDRFFRPEDVKNLRLIYFLLRNQKFSIEGAKKHLKDNKDNIIADFQIVQSLKKVKFFLLELRANLDT